MWIFFVSVKGVGGNFLIGNFHGLWNGIDKLDSEDRLRQSENIMKFLDNRKKNYKILCGDFNLRPDTESIKILEKDMNNLIKTFGIKSTRTSLYTKLEKHADYIFTSPEIKINHFEVAPNEVSDHSPLLLDFN